MAQFMRSDVERIRKRFLNVFLYHKSKLYLVVKHNGFSQKSRFFLHNKSQERDNIISTKKKITHLTNQIICILKTFFVYVLTDWIVYLL